MNGQKLPYPSYLREVILKHFGNPLQSGLTHISQNQLWQNYNQNYYLPIVIRKPLKYVAEN